MKNWNMTECNKVTNDLEKLQEFAKRIQAYIARKDPQDYKKNNVYQNLDNIIAIIDNANEHVYLM